MGNRRLSVPGSDEPIQRPQSEAVYADAVGGRTVRRGSGRSGHWDWGSRFTTPEEVFAFSPLAEPDFTWMGIGAAYDYSDEERLYAELRMRYPAAWGDRAPAGSTAQISTYNTMFMWPLLTFGWQLFLETCLDSRFERIMDEFAEIYRRLFRVFARLPVNFVWCHDDIVATRGPVCSPAWMSRYIFPRYEEFFGIVKSAGKQVLFLVDGCIDIYADTVMSCGARGIRTEPYSDFRTIARRHDNPYLCGEGDNRVLMTNDRREILNMVMAMLETGKMTAGYMMGIGNHIPWNVPPEAVKCYLDFSHELG